MLLNKTDTSFNNVTSLTRHTLLSSHAPCRQDTRGFMCDGRRALCKLQLSKHNTNLMWVKFSSKMCMRGIFKTFMNVMMMPMKFTLKYSLCSSPISPSSKICHLITIEWGAANKIRNENGDRGAFRRGAGRG